MRAVGRGTLAGMRALLVTSLLLHVATPEAFEVPGALQKLLDDRKWDSTPAGFRIIALSHLADGCVAQAAAKPGTEADGQRCVAQTLALAKKLGPSKHGLFLSHLNLLYGAADAVGSCPDVAEHTRLSKELAARSLRDPLAHAASYEGTAFRWPADQSVTLASLGRFDRAHGTHLLDEPLTRWRAQLEKSLDATTKLPRSELTGKGSGAKYPRGCAQSYLTRYVSEVDPVLAASWWAPYREQFLVRLGPVVGFREWPRGVERKADVDSGPILFGVGTAASALAVSAARSQGDLALATQLEANQQTALASGAGGAAAKSVLAEAIQFEGHWHLPAR